MIDSSLGYAFLVARCNFIRASRGTKKEGSSYSKEYVEKNDLSL